MTDSYVTMPTLLFVSIVVVGIGNVFAGGEYCMYNKFYLFCFLIFLTLSLFLSWRITFLI